MPCLVMIGCYIIEFSENIYWKHQQNNYLNNLFLIFHWTGVANQSQIDNEIARSLLDLSQRQVQPSEDTAKEISANVVFHTKTGEFEFTICYM